MLVARPLVTFLTPTAPAVSSVTPWCGSLQKVVASPRLSVLCRALICQRSDPEGLWRARLVSEAWTTGWARQSSQPGGGRASSVYTGCNLLSVCIADIRRLLD